jgi:hypothetical protein
MTILAKDLQVGDVITSPGLIPLTVETLRHYPEHHAVVFEYPFAGGLCGRTYFEYTPVQIAPRKIEEAH